jgi:CheY-like chemotaxis protein
MSNDKKTIMIVDDEEIILNTAKRILRLAGYECVLAKNGFEAIEIYQQQYQLINVVIIDMTMPNMDGIDTYKKLAEINPDIKVIFASGYTKEENQEKLEERGIKFAKFIEKPFSAQNFIELIKETVG